MSELRLQPPRVHAEQCTSPRHPGADVIGLVDLDGDGRHEIVIHDSAPFFLYSADGKRRITQVGCYFGG